MHRDLTRSIWFLLLTFLLVTAAASTGRDGDPGDPLPPLHDRCRHSAGRRSCQHADRSHRAPAPATLSARSGPDLDWPPAARTTHRGRRGARARRRGCRGGQAWRRSSADGRKWTMMIGMLNIQSLLPKIAVLQHEELRRFDHDCFVLTETWLRSATATRLIAFPGYTLHRADRPGDAGYGGVAVLARSGYQAAVTPQPPA